MSHKAQLNVLPENSMVSPPDINPYSWMNASYGSSVVDTLSPQRLDTMPDDVCAGSGYLWHQEVPMLNEHTQAHNATEYFNGANEITDPMTLGASSDTNGAGRVLYWQRGDDTWAHAWVRVKDQIRDSMTFLWPAELFLVIHAAGISRLKLQGWIQKNHAPVSRVKCVPGTDNRDFDDLVRLLRNCGGYATVGWEAGGSLQARLLLVPLGTDLLCVAFPVEGIPKLPTSQSLEPDYMNRSVIPSSSTGSRPAHVDDPVAMASSLERPYALIPRRWSQSQEVHPSLDIIEAPHVDLDLFVQQNQEIKFTSVDAMSLPHAPLEQQSNSQQAQQVTALNMLSVGKQLGDWQMDLDATSSRGFYPADGFGSALPWQDSRTYLGIGENTTGYYTNVDMKFGAIFGDADVFESSVGTGLEVCDSWTHDSF